MHYPVLAAFIFFIIINEMLSLYRSSFLNGLMKPVFRGILGKSFSKSARFLTIPFVSTNDLLGDDMQVDDYRKELLSLDKLVLMHDNLYYNMMEPVISDAEYDSIVSRMEAIG